MRISRTIRWARVTGLLAAMVLVLAPLASSPRAQAAPAPAPATGLDLRLSLVPDASEARYRAQEQLAGQNLPNQAVGTTRLVSGDVVFAADGSLLEGSKILVDLRGLRSDESRRDNWIQRNTLETHLYPFAEFVPRQAPGLPWPLPPAGDVNLQLVGDLTVHGVTQPVVWDAVVSFAEPEIAGSAWTRVRMTDFGMTPPQVGPVLSLEDELTLELDFRAAPVAGAALLSSLAPAELAQAACVATRPDALGPFYVPDAPIRDRVGSGYLLGGSVSLAGSCEPLPGALIELWQANPSGVYDDDHRASLYAGPAGEYSFESDPPPPYAGRPPHIHLRVSAPGARTLVTQHYPQPGQTEATFDLVLLPL